MSDTSIHDAELEQHSARIAESMLRVMRTQGAIRARMVTADEGDASTTFVLLDLVRRGPCRAADLAEHLCADPSTVSRQVASLVKAGLVAREADPDDGRASILVPTEAGLELARKRAVRRGQAIRPVIANWSAQDRETFLRLLQEFNVGLDAHRESIIAGYRSAATSNERSAS